MLMIITLLEAGIKWRAAVYVNRMRLLLHEFRSRKNTREEFVPCRVYSYDEMVKIHLFSELLNKRFVVIEDCWLQSELTDK